MSSNTVQLNTGQQAIITTDVSKIFLWNNRFDSGSYTNDGYDDVTLAAGTVMGRISATQKIVPLQSDASDGSQFPIGILNQTRVVEGGDTVTLAYCVSGDVAEEKLVFTKAGDSLTTVVSSRSLRDRIGADTVGVNLVAATENSAYDNQ